MGSRVASGPRHGDYQRLKAGIRLVCSSMRTMGDGLSSSWAESRSVGSMRLFLPSRRLFHLGKAKARSSSSSPPMLRSTVGSSRGWRNVPRWDWRAQAPPRATAAATSCWPSPPRTLSRIIPKTERIHLTHLADTHLNPLITATVEATEEAILNALTMATTVWDATAIVSRPSPSPDSVPSSITTPSNCGESVPCEARRFPHLHFPLLPRYPLATLLRLED